MLLASKGIVFHTLKYGDTSLIARIYTREAGLQAFLIKGVRSQKGAIRPSHLMPLNLVDMVFTLRQDRQLQILKELKCDPVLFEVHVNPIKRGIMLFITELLNRAIREEEKNEALFDFLANSIQILDLQKDNLQLFPHHFCLQLSRYLGFYPDQNYQDGYCLDLVEGCFVPANKVGPQFLNAEESKLAATLMKRSMNQDITASAASNERRNLLEGILRYFRLHFDHFRDLKSHEILREVLSV